MSAGPQNVLRELEAALLYTPPRLRSAHIRRLDRLIPEIRPDRLYTYEYVFQRITGFDPEADGEAVLDGRTLRSGLGRLLRKLSQATPLKAVESDDEVLLMSAVAAQCRVGLATLRRWAKHGLPVACYTLADGRQGWGVRRPALEQFLAARQARPVREGRRLTEEDRRVILALAHELSGGGETPAGVIAQLVERTHFSASTVRRLLRQAGAAPEEPSADTCGLPAPAFEEMVRLSRAGTGAPALAKRFNRPADQVCRALHRARIRQVLGVKIGYIPNAAFGAPDAEALCLGAEGWRTRAPEPTPAMPAAPANVPPFLAELYRIPLLAREREAELFRKYNYIKYRAALLQEQIRRTGYRAGMIERFEEWQAAAEEVRRILIRSNLRLVVSIAKRHMGPLTALPELVSEGNLCLIRAVECYDCAREARFATYATWAIAKHFARVVPEENYRMAAFVTGQQEKLDATGDRRVDARERAEIIDHVRAVLAQATQTLTERERVVIVSHFGTDGRPARTLEEIGAGFGLTRERIRQIEARALLKLRRAIAPEALEAVT